MKEELIEKLKSEIIEVLNLEDLTPADIDADAPLFGEGLGLDSIYAHYGYYTELVFSRDYEGAAGKEQMKKIMADMRTLKAGDTFVGREIAKVEDLLGENTGFPKADVIIIRFTSGEKLVVRPSGTEPKIKYYIFLVEGKTDTVMSKIAE